MTKIKNEFDPNIQINARKLGIYGEIARKHEASGRCVFCHLKDEYVITRLDGWALTVNLFPRSTGDLLVIPERHIESYEDLSDADLVTYGRLNKIGTKLLSEVLEINSFYLLLREGKEADKTVRHLHGHIQHYWEGLVDWHPQDEMIPPPQIAIKLREGLEKNGIS
jgi:diadenosine tetraphosphate (Ap4A) HIT family hydrolase